MKQKITTVCHQLLLVQILPQMQITVHMPMSH